MPNEQPTLLAFRYRAQTPTGQAISGTLDAADHDTAIQTLRSMDLELIEVEAEARPRPRGIITAEDFIAFNQQLASLTEAGLPIEQGLRLIANETLNPRLARSIKQVAHEVEAGKPLGEAFNAHRSMFPRMYGRLLDAGIAANNLPAMLYGLGRHLDLLNRLRAALWQAIAYPMVVLLVLALVMGFIGGVVLPMFTTIFEDFDTDMPTLTLALLQSRHWLPWAMGGLAALIMLAPAVWWACRAVGIDATIADSFGLPLPLIGQVLKRNLIARWCDTVRLGVNAGLDLPQCFALAADALQSPSITHDSRQMIASLEYGHPLANLRKLAVIPPSVTAAIDLATGQNRLAEALATLTELYRQQAETRIAMVNVLMTPLLLLFLALVIGFVVIALFLPMIKVLHYIM